IDVLVIAASYSVYLHDALPIFHERWWQYRQDRSQPIGMTDADRVNLYRTMVRVAERALTALLDEPDLAQVVDGGLAATDLTQIQDRKSTRLNSSHSSISSAVLR